MIYVLYRQPLFIENSDTFKDYKAFKETILLFMISDF